MPSFTPAELTLFLTARVAAIIVGSSWQRFLLLRKSQVASS
ncbi:hypothetical protein ACN28E_32285 [Archangium lansingense]